MIDASGKYVFPGFIDPHVHIYLPFMGTFAKDTHETASKAALVGGTTTFIEMVCPARDGQAAGGFRALARQSARQKRLRFHVSHGRDAVRRRSRSRISTRSSGAGCSSFKIFLAYKGAFGVDRRGAVSTRCKLAKELGVITTAHCENADLVLELQKKLLSRRKDRAGMASLEPAAAGRSRRRASPDDFRRNDRRARLHRAHELRRGAARSDARRDSAA